MSSAPIINPELPYVGEVEGGLRPGLMVKIQGVVPPDSMRFAINYQLGPNLNPRDDIALHVSPRFNDGFITRNTIVSMTWGTEENGGPMWIKQGERFEIIILCEYYCYKIAVNGRHFAEFAHRLPYQKVTHLVIDGQVEISSIFYEVIPVGPQPSAPIPDVPPVNVGPPGPGGLYPTLNDPQEKFGPPPSSGEDYRHNPPYKQKSEEEEGFSGFDKVGLAVGAAVAAGGVAAAMHAYNKNKKKHEGEADYEKSEAKGNNESGLGGLGALGAALASSLASNALQGSSAHTQQGYPPAQNSNGGGFLGSILGAMAPPAQPAQPQDPFQGALGSILGGVLGQQHQPPPQQPAKGLGESLLGAAFESLGKRAFGMSHDHEEGGDHYGGGGGSYAGYPSPQGGGGYGGGGYGGGGYGGHQAPPSGTVYGGRHDDHPPQGRPPSPPAPGGGKLSAAEISRGLGLGDDEE